MAETVKKSRIVSDIECLNDNLCEESSLQDIINEEFNQRLKNCMNNETETKSTEETTQKTSDTIEITTEEPLNGLHTSENLSTSADSDSFANDENPSPEITMEQIIITDTNAKDRFLADADENSASVKDRMFLSTESACLLFTQTVQSPMLTPTEENYDFVQALRNRSSSNEEPTEPTDQPNPESNGPLIIHSEKETANMDQICETVLNEHISDLASPKMGNMPELIAESIPKVNGPFDVDETDKSTSDIKILTSEFIENEMYCCGKLTDGLEDIVEVTERKSDVAPDVIDVAETVTSDVENEQFIKTDYDSHSECDIEIIDKPSDEQLSRKSPNRVSEISKIFSGEEQERPFRTPSPIPDVADTVRRTKQIFERNESPTDITNTNLSVSKTIVQETTTVEAVIDDKGQEKVHKKKKTKKSKKDSEKENISVKSSFSKFDALSKKTVLHVRSSDSSKAQEKFNGSAPTDLSSCKSCGKPVFQMELVKAEKAAWHKNCFRCKECNKQLTVDTYQSNEGVLYCKPHFKALFSPKVVEESQPVRPRKHEMIIRENQPLELPPDVIRASDKPDLGLEELQNLNVKERFQVFEQHETNENNLDRSSSTVNVKRSPSILSKLAKFQSRGMDVGVGDESLNGVPIDNSASESEEDDEIEGEDADLIRARKQQREKPLHFNNMSDIMNKWESGAQLTKEERREERKQEIQSIRSRLFMGKQGKMKELYQQAVAESESGANVKKQIPTEICENTKSIKEKFERGEVLTKEEEQKLNDTEDMSVFESGISKKSRSIFLELDANASKAPQMAPISPAKSTSDVRRARQDSSPDQEIYRDPEIIRSEESHDDSAVVQKSHTATKMLSIFRQMEENVGKEPVSAGPKPLKRFTPPPEPSKDDGSSEEEETESDIDDADDVDNEQKMQMVDEDLIEAQKAARAKQLRAKFERWEANEIQREQNNSSVNLAEEFGEEQSQIESAKSLRARFESMRETTNSNKDRTPRAKVNRFVDTTNNVEICKSCEGRVYPLEKISCHNSVYHKNCFRCRECNTILRMDSYSYNQGLLYCTPHFKRLFIAKGDYESGFGLDQPRGKWNSVA